MKTIKYLFIVLLVAINTVNSGIPVNNASDQLRQLGGSLVQLKINLNKLEKHLEALQTKIETIELDKASSEERKKRIRQLMIKAQKKVRTDVRAERLKRLTPDQIAQSLLAKKATIKVTNLGDLFSKDPRQNYLAKNTEQVYDATTRKKVDTLRYYPTETAIKFLVEKEWPNVSPVMVKKFKGGSYTGALFAVSTEPQPGKPGANIFFVKVSNINAQQAAQNLTAIQESSVGRLMNAALRHPTMYSKLPILTTVEQLFKYQGFDSKQYTIEVTHAARGQCVYDILMKKVPTPAPFEEIGFTVGKAMGSFHCRCIRSGDPQDPATWRTITHNDAHPSNMFYYKTPHFSRIYFIDNETMAKSLPDPKSILADVVFLIFLPTIYWNKTISPNWDNFKPFFRGFLNGYSAAYPQEVQQALQVFLKNEFLQRIAVLKNSKLIAARDTLKVQEFERKAKQLFYFYVPVAEAQAIQNTQLNDLETIAHGLTPVATV